MSTGLSFTDAGALVELATPQTDHEFAEVEALVEYAGDPITYMANLPAFTEIGILVELATAQVDHRFGEIKVLVETAIAQDDHRFGEIGILVEYGGDPVSYIADLPSFAEVGALVEVLDWWDDSGGPPPVTVAVFGPIVWVM